MTRQFELAGLDGANPLGFLAALGVLVTLDRRGERDARIAWTRRHTWVPVLDQVGAASEADLSEIVANGLRGRAVSEETDRRREEVRKAMDAAKTEVKKQWDEIRRRALTAAGRKEARDRELRPLEEKLATLRDQYARILLEAAPRAELALGKRIEDAAGEHYRQLAQGLLETTDAANRDELDQLAALGSDGCLDDQGQLRPTPFEFSRGGGWQFFLEDIRKLLAQVTPERVHGCLFRPWAYRDEKLSLRWDPVEDRRYALMDRDPSDEGTRTVWMANLLAYRGLALFPAVPSRAGLAVAGWREHEGSWAMTWPIWSHPVPINVIASMLRLRELVSDDPNGTALRARGITAVYRARRIEVGEGANRKLNFAPARAVL